MSAAPFSTARQRAARTSDGHALLDTFASTLGLLRALLFALIAIYLCSGITRVAPNEDALIYRFGRLQQTLHPPGLLFALPAPIDRVVKVATRTQHEISLTQWSPEEDNALLAAIHPGQPAPPPVSNGLHPVFDGYTVTGDVNIVQARFSVRYRIVDPRAYTAAAPPQVVTSLIDASIYNAATRTLAGMKIDDVLGAGLSSLRDQVRTLAQQHLDSFHLGVDLVSFEIAALTPPSATAAAFADVTNAQVESRTMVESSRTYRAEILPKVRGEAYRISQQADAHLRQLTARATAEAGSFLALLAEYRAAPALVETRLRANTKDEVLARVKTKTLLPGDGGQLNLFLRDTP